MTRKQNNFGAKYGNEENNKEGEWINNMAKELQELEEGRKLKIHHDSPRATLKKHQIGKCLAMMAYMDIGLENSLLSMTDWLWNA